VAGRSELLRVTASNKLTALVDRGMALIGKRVNREERLFGAYSEPHPNENDWSSRIDLKSKIHLLLETNRRHALRLTTGGNWHALFALNPGSPVAMAELGR
jgi:hypothetical protein